MGTQFRTKKKQFGTKNERNNYLSFFYKVRVTIFFILIAFCYKFVLV